MVLLYTLLLWCYSMPLGMRVLLLTCIAIAINVGLYQAYRRRWVGSNGSCMGRLDYCVRWELRAIDR